MTFKDVRAASILIGNNLNSIADAKTAYRLKKIIRDLANEAEAIDAGLAAIAKKHSTGEKESKEIRDMVKYNKEVSAYLDGSTDLIIEPIAFQTLEDAKKACGEGSQAFVLHLTDIIFTVKEFE